MPSVNKTLSLFPDQELKPIKEAPPFITELISFFRTIAPKTKA
jgi:hypothetical protein